jgi:hypothetical protein
VIKVGLGARDGQVVQDRPAATLQGSEQARGAPLAGAEEHDPTPGPLAAEQFNQRLDVCANPNAHQPRPQVLGADNLLQFGLELEQFSTEPPEIRLDQAVISMATGGIAAS